MANREWHESVWTADEYESAAEYKAKRVRPPELSLGEYWQYLTQLASMHQLGPNITKARSAALARNQAERAFPFLLAASVR